MNEALDVLRMRLELLKMAIRRELLKLLGVDVMVELAFKEGWKMHSQSDPNRIIRKYHGVFVTISGTDDLSKIVHETRCWRSVQEAWVNSDAQEEFE